MGNQSHDHRVCIVTRQDLLKEELLRFVLDPDNRVHPDLDNKLPGRGAWVSLSSKLVQKAVRKGAFMRAFGQKVDIEHDLSDRVDGLLVQRLISSISLCKKAGILVTGLTKVDQAIRQGNARLIIHAIDAGSDGKAKVAKALKVARACGFYEGMALNPIDGLDAIQLGAAAGQDHVVHAVVLEGGLTGKVSGLFKRLERYRKATKHDKESKN